MGVDSEGRIYRTRPNELSDGDKIKVMIDWLLNPANEGAKYPPPFLQQPELLRFALSMAAKERREGREQIIRDMTEQEACSKGPEVRAFRPGEDRLDCYKYALMGGMGMGLIKDSPCPDRQENKKEGVTELCLCSKLLWKD